MGEHFHDARVLPATRASGTVSRALLLIVVPDHVAKDSEAPGHGRRSIHGGHTRHPGSRPLLMNHRQRLLNDVLDHVARNPSARDFEKSLAQWAEPRGFSAHRGLHSTHLATVSNLSPDILS
jgi:hypothetical protein